MSIPSAAEHVVTKQSAELLQRAAVGTAGGVFAVTHLGPRFAVSVVNFVTSSLDAERAYIRFARSSLNFERRRDLASRLILEKRTQQMDALVAKAGLKPEDVTILRKELENHRLALKRIDESGQMVSEKIAASNSLATVRRVTRGDVTRDLLSARVRVGFLDMVSELSHAGRKASPKEMQFLVAYRKVSKVIGSELEGGWKKAIDYLIENAAEVKLYRNELERLEGVIAKEKDPEKLAHLTDRAFEAVRKRGVHNMLKGLLAELYSVRWKDWALQKSGYMEIATRLAGKLGKEWEAVPFNGNLFLGGQQAWDEAILLVRKGSHPPEAKLFLAAQIKAAIDPTALAQTLNDVAREAVSKDLRIVLADGREEWYLLTSLPQGVRSHRWVLNAAGGEFPKGDIAALFRSGVQVHQQTLPITLVEFNLLADRLLKACADLF